jgi:thiol:disulfide interchange protein DsbC
MELAELIGVTGTPALILPDGELLPGYVPADRLKAVLEKQLTAGQP